MPYTTSGKKVNIERLRITLITKRISKPIEKIRIPVFLKNKHVTNIIAVITVNIR